MTTVSSHDRLFRSAMTDLRVAREFFQSHLPNKILSVTDLNILNHCPTSYIDSELKMSQSDVLYQTRIAHSDAYFYLLCEHQSTPDIMMPFRLLKYCVGIWNDVLKQKRQKLNKLPLIVAMVFYNGKSPYPYSMDFKSLLNAPMEIIDQIWEKPFLLVDVGQIPDQTFRQYRWSGIMEFFMKHVVARDFLPYLIQVIDHLYMLEHDNGADYVVSLLNYALKSTQMADLQAFTDTVKNHLTLPTSEKIMTLAEQLIARGMQQGIQKGMQKGMQKGEYQLLMRLLRHKFPTIDNRYIALIEKADEETLLSWGERLMDATSLSDIFDC